MIPVESSEIEAWQPPSLANLPAPPVFKLRAASGREMRKYQYVMQVEGLEYHSMDAIRGEVLVALKALYTPDLFEASAARLRSFWALLDQNAKAANGGKVEPDPAEEEAVNDLVERLTREWRPLARMGADNMRFVEESLRIAVSMFLVGWSGLDLAYRREDGRVPLGLIDELEEKLQAIERQAKADQVEGVGRPGMAFIELCNAAQKRLRLTEDEEKKSSSPPSSPPGRSGSKRKSSRKTAAASSRASASSGSETAAA